MPSESAFAERHNSTPAKLTALCDGQSWLCLSERFAAT
jgi:hypothetical protein